MHVGRGEKEKGRRWGEMGDGVEPERMNGKMKTGTAASEPGLLSSCLTLEEEAAPTWSSWYCGQHNRHAHWAALVAPI